MQPGDGMIPVLSHRPATRLLYAKETLVQKFPVLAKFMPMVKSFQPSKVAPGKRVKGTYCLQCALEEIAELELLDIDVSNASAEELENLASMIKKVLNDQHKF